MKKRCSVPTILCPGLLNSRSSLTFSSHAGQSFSTCPMEFQRWPRAPQRTAQPCKETLGSAIPSGGAPASQNQGNVGQAKPAGLGFRSSNTQISPIAAECWILK